MVERTIQLLTKNKRDEHFEYVEPGTERNTFVSDLSLGGRIEFAVPHKVILMGKKRCPETNRPLTVMITYKGNPNKMREIYDLAIDHPAQ